ncbi:hypothetical protein HPG69_010314 [Diceros bicornis minor]|uniref:Uncharacterized protein n=1 Tax=Diceros bicornis minor TaxID=77932 RepID=A0A7J7E941_DICBM|nr:hypothetical protein HPG69_010314 [Diceros bicornis minor]
MEIKDVHSSSCWKWTLGKNNTEHRLPVSNLHFLHFETMEQNNSVTEFILLGLTQDPIRQKMLDYVNNIRESTIGTQKTLTRLVSN